MVGNFAFAKELWFFFLSENAMELTLLNHSPPPLVSKLEAEILTTQIFRVSNLIGFTHMHTQVFTTTYMVFHPDYIYFFSVQQSSWSLSKQTNKIQE